MKTPEEENVEDEMLPEYNFSDGVRGKHYQAYRAGHTVTIRRSDGTEEVHRVEEASGMVELAPDVQAYFPDSESVNGALRGLIRLIPKQSESE